MTWHGGPPGWIGEEVEASRRAHGSNRLEEIRGLTFAELFRARLGDATLRLLIICAILVLVAGLFREGAIVESFAVLAAVALCALVGAGHDHRAQAEFQSLQIESEGFPVRVRRDARTQEVSAFDLVVGDVVLLETGDKVPADGELVAGEIEVDEALLTGESGSQVRSTGGSPGLRGGTLVAGGRGVMQVTAVGVATEYGRLRAALALGKEPTPLQVRLDALARGIGFAGLAGAVAVFASLLVAGVATGRIEASLAGGVRVLSDLALAVTIVVVAVPEGLPVAVTLALAYAVRRMSGQRCLVRRLLACETMGAADVLLLDKTGTVTRNRMTARRMWLAGVGEFDPLAPPPIPASQLQALGEIAAVDSTAHDTPYGGGRTRLGNPTELALLDVLVAWGLDPEVVRTASEVLVPGTFRPERRRMDTLVARSGGARWLVKGAPEEILGQAVSVLTVDGPGVLDPDEHQQLLARVSAWSGRGDRTLALAYRDVADGPAARAAVASEGNLVLVGLVGLEDPVRPGAAVAIQACRARGIEVVLVTGDHQLTGESVAREIGLLGEGDLSLEAARLRELSDPQIDDALDRLRVVWRALPSDKVRLVEAFQSRGRTVAVTGDGSNDAPALRRADVGLALGASGTELAREAADMVILDDSLETIVTTVSWGRAIFRNVQRFLRFQLTVSATALGLALIAGLSGRELPFTIVQLLWVNLIMDSLAALALASEGPEASVLPPAPHGRTSPLLSRDRILGVVATSGLMIAVLAALFFANPTGGDAARHRTLVFNAFVFMQIAHLVLCRLQGSSLAGLLVTPLFPVLVAAIVLVQTAIVMVGGEAFATVPLTAGDWLVTMGLTAFAALSAHLAAPAFSRVAARGTGFVAGLAASLVEGHRGRFEDLGAVLDRPIRDLPTGILAGAGMCAALTGLLLRGAGDRHVPAAFAPLASVSPPSSPIGPGP